MLEDANFGTTTAGTPKSSSILDRTWQWPDSVGKLSIPMSERLSFSRNGLTSIDIVLRVSLRSFRFRTKGKLVLWKNNYYEEVSDLVLFFSDLKSDISH